jgi:hypothetical protein
VTLECFKHEEQAACGTDLVNVARDKTLPFNNTYIFCKCLHNLFVLFTEVIVWHATGWYGRGLTCPVILEPNRRYVHTYTSTLGNVCISIQPVTF